MLRDSARLLSLATLLLLLLWFALLGICCRAEAAAVPAQEQTQREVMVQVPLSKLKELRALMDSQGKKIDALESQLSAPMSTLSEQQSTIDELRQSLAIAKDSLNKSELIISEQNACLTSLSESIKQDKRRTQRVKRQRLLWQVAAGGAVVALVKTKT